MNSRVPFRRRLKGDIEIWNVLLEGVPTHLKVSLQRFISRVVSNDRDLAGVIQRRLRLPFDSYPTPSDLVNYVERDPEASLDMVEVLVQEIWAAASDQSSSYTYRNAMDLVNELAQILDDSNSAYQIEKFENYWRLTTRVDPTVTQALHDAIELNPDAGALLAVAWQGCFRHEPDYDTAYDNAILAVESVATKLFTPNDPSPSLGKAIAHLSDTMSRWTISGLDTEKQDSSTTLLGMLQTMWTAQNRHVKKGGIAPTPTTKEEAEAVVFLAISIVQLFSRNLIQSLVE